MSDDDVDTLLVALENDQNSSIVNLDSSKIKEIKNNILQKIQIDRDTLKQYHKKLKHYRYCSDLSDLQYGNYIRWISLKNANRLKLTSGAFYVDYFFENNMVKIRCKNNRGMFFQIKFDEVLIFQKFNEQEKILLKVMDYLKK
jgi:hypothetical protein